MKMRIVCVHIELRMLTLEKVYGGSYDICQVGKKIVGNGRKINMERLEYKRNFERTNMFVGKKLICSDDVKRNTVLNI